LQLPGWLSPAGRGVPAREVRLGQVAAGIASSPEALRRNVAGYYAALLGSGPDAAGADAWLQVLVSGQLKTGMVAVGLLASDEYFGDANSLPG
jgi:hypothetical protein